MAWEKRTPEHRSAQATARSARAWEPPVPWAAQALEPAAVSAARALEQAVASAARAAACRQAPRPPKAQQVPRRALLRVVQPPHIQGQQYCCHDDQRRPGCRRSTIHRPATDPVAFRQERPLHPPWRQLTRYRASRVQLFALAVRRSVGRHPVWRRGRAREERWFPAPPKPRLSLGPGSGSHSLCKARWRGDPAGADQMPPRRNRQGDRPDIECCGGRVSTGRHFESSFPKTPGICGKR